MEPFDDLLPVELSLTIVSVFFDVIECHIQGFKASQTRFSSSKVQSAAQKSTIRFKFRRNNSPDHREEIPIEGNLNKSHTSNAIVSCNTATLGNTCPIRLLRLCVWCGRVGCWQSCEKWTNVVGRRLPEKALSVCCHHQTA